MTQTIVYFVDSPTFGGSEQALLNLLSGIDRKRWKPILFHYDEVGIAPLINGAQQLDIQTQIVPRMEGWQTVSALPQFLKYIRALQPVVFHAQLCWLLSCKYGLLAARLARAPAVIATAQHFMHPPWGRTVYLQQQLVTRCVDQYIAVSQAVAIQLQNTFNVPSKLIQVVYNGIPYSRYTCTPDTILKTGLTGGRTAPIILTVARLNWQKGHRYLFEAISQVREVILLLAGGGPEKELLENKVYELGIQDRVIFLGERNDVPQLLANCDLFVLPSFNEGLPLSVLEAMAAGKAVVATAVGGTPEVVQDGETGILVPPRDPSALANAIQSLLSDPGEACKMGDAGRARVQQYFSSDIMVQRITQTYEGLLNNHHTV